MLFLLVSLSQVEQLVDPFIFTRLFSNLLLQFIKTEIHQGKQGILLRSNYKRHNFRFDSFHEDNISYYDTCIISKNDKFMLMIPTNKMWYFLQYRHVPNDSFNLQPRRIKFSAVCSEQLLIFKFENTMIVNQM